MWLTAKRTHKIVADLFLRGALWLCRKTGSRILEKVLQKLGDEAPNADAATEKAVQQVCVRPCHY